MPTIDRLAAPELMLWPTARGYGVKGWHPVLVPAPPLERGGASPTDKHGVRAPLFPAPRRMAISHGYPPTEPLSVAAPGVELPRRFSARPTGAMTATQTAIKKIAKPGIGSLAPLPTKAALSAIMS